jgi:hypothetical protein
MADLEVFQNGNFSDGRPVFQVRSNKEDGTYDIVNANLMSEEEANAALAELQPATETKRTRARTDEGQFIADDPTTPENEAWVEEPVAKKKAPAKKKTTAKKK